MKVDELSCRNILMKILIEILYRGRLTTSPDIAIAESAAREQPAADMSVSPASKPKDRKKNDLEEQPLAN
jgi:hypothetical protein